LLYLIICDSYIEGIVRGYRNALLTSQNYSNLTQCETIDGISDLATATSPL
jgi:V-type H+-transporting ATPase subunit d